MTNQRLGSTRIITAVRPGVVEFGYTKQWSVFDRGPSPQLIEGFDTSRAQCAVLLFEAALKRQLRTHFIRQVSETAFEVSEYSIPGQPSLSGKTCGRVIPLEWLYRTRAKGSLLKRLQSGRAKPEDFGFEPGTEVSDGMKLPKLHIECTTKFEEVDRHLSYKEARALSGLSEYDWHEALETVRQVAAVSEEVHARAGFDNSDGKCELALNDHVGIVPVDVFGTQDENRITDSKTGEIYCKDLLRIELESMPWKQELDEATRVHPHNKSKWPNYPALEPQFLAMVGQRYAEVPRRIKASLAA